MTQSWIDYNVLAHSSEAVSSDDLNNEVRRYFEDNARSGGGRMIEGGIKSIDDRDFILPFSESGTAQRVIDRKIHNLCIINKQYVFEVGKCPNELAGHYVVGLKNVKRDRGDGMVSSCFLLDNDRNDSNEERPHGYWVSRSNSAEDPYPALTLDEGATNGSPQRVPSSVDAEGGVVKFTANDAPACNEISTKAPFFPGKDNERMVVSPVTENSDKTAAHSGVHVVSPSKKKKKSKKKRKPSIGSENIEESAVDAVPSPDGDEMSWGTLGTDGGGDSVHEFVPKVPVVSSFRSLRHVDSWNVNKIALDAAEHSQKHRALLRSPSSTTCSNLLGSMSLEEIGRSIFVQNIPDEDLDIVKLHLENHRVGGGEIHKIHVIPDEGCAIVTFYDPNVAKSLIDRRQLSMKSRFLSIEPIPNDQGASGQSQRSNDIPRKDLCNSSPLHPQPLSIMVTYSDDTVITEDILRLYFENSKRSGGGTISNIRMNPNAHRAMITFSDPAVVQSVMNRAPHLLLKVELTVTVVDESIQYPSKQASRGNDDSRGHPAASIPSSRDLEKLSCAIRVVGLKKTTAMDTVVMFFENRRRSGGGGTVETFVKAEENCVIVVFESHEIVENVLQQHSSSPLKLEDARLNISILQPLPPAPPLAEDVDPNLFLVGHLPEERQSRDLKLYFHKGLALDVEQVTFSLQPGIALIQLARSTPCSYEAAQRLVCSKPFAGSMLSIEQVLRPTSIQVHNIGKLSAEYIYLYLENERIFKSVLDQASNVKNPNITVEVLKWYLLKEEGCAIFEFSNPAVIELLLKRDHTLEGQTIKMKIYYECLGPIPPDVDASEPICCIPPNITLTFDVKILEFAIGCNSVKNSIEVALKQEYCEIVWPSPGQPYVMLVCKLTRKTTNVHRLASTWAEKCKEITNKHLQDLWYEEISILQDLWSQLVDALKSHIQQRDDLMKVSLVNATHSVCIVGQKDKCKEFMKLIKTQVERIQHEMEEAKKIVTEELGTLKVHQILLLQKVEMLPAKSAEITKDGVKIELAKTGKPLFTGMPKDVMAMTIKVLEKINTIVDDKFSPPAFMVRLLTMPAFVNHLEQTLLSKAIQIIWTLEKSGSVSVHGFSRDDVDNGISVFKAEFIEKVIPLENEAANKTLQRLEWTDLKNSLIKGIDTLIIEENAEQIALTCTMDVIENPLEQISNYLKEFTVLKKFVPAIPQVITIIEMYKKENVQRICSAFKSCSVDIVQEGCGYRISGTVHGLQNAVDKFKEILKSVEVRVHSIQHPGMSQFFHSPKGKKDIVLIENRHKAVIREFDEQAEEEIVVDVDQDDIIGTAGSDIQTIAGFGRSFQVKIVVSDIVRYNVDAIVNAANDELKHIGGVAGSISSAGGPSIQKECDEYIKKNNRLRPGQCFVSKAGNLPCKAIIHAVGPIWKNGQCNEENLLYYTITDTLETAERLKYISIALPAISTGIYGFPLNKAAKVILEAIEEFCRKRSTSSLEEVHIVDNSQRVTSQFSETLNELYPDKIIQSSNRPSKPVPTPRRQFSRETPARRSGGKKMHDHHHHESSVDDSSMSFQSMPSMFVDPGLSILKGPPSSPSAVATPSGLKIKLIKGSIVDEQTDVIVNTTAHNLNLTSGAVSSLLLKVAGPGLQTECTQKCAQGLKTPGQIVVTSGYNLACTEVYHGACHNWDSGAGACEKSIRDLVTAVLAQADKSGHKSIALPAIGTGKLQVPNDLVAKWMFEEVEDFSRKHPTTSLSKIRFVVFPTDKAVLAAFKSEFTNRTATVQSKPSNTRILVKMGNRVSAAAASFTNTDEAPVKSGGWSIKIGSLNLEVCQGDITTENVDAIVNSTNEALDLSQGAVSRAIFEAAGQQVQDECSKLVGTAKTNGFAVTSSGRLPCKHIFHIVCPRSSPKWKALIGKCLQEADKLGLNSIVFPLLGTGNAHCSVADMASVMLDAICDFSTSKLHSQDTASASNAGLSLVRITIFQSHMVGEFSIALDKKVSERTSSGLWKPRVDIKVSELLEQKRFSFEDHIRFRICAMSVADVEAVIKDLEDLGQDTVKEKTVTSHNIAKLTEEQVTRIKNLEMLYPVKITLDRGTKNEIHIQGEMEFISHVQEEIYQIFSEVLKADQEKMEARLLKKQATWSYATANGYDLYPENINALIEKAYRNKEPAAVWEEDDGKYSVTFNTMEEYKVGSANPVKVKRTSDDNSLPKTWDTMNAGDLCLKVALTPGTQEYTDVETNVKATAVNTCSQIISIERIQNPTLYQQYALRRNDMTRRQVVPGVPIERTLWHGTSADTLESINHTGFNRSYCGKNAVVYGRGVYFAQQFSYSAANTYAIPDVNGQKYVYLSRVLTGQFVVGHQSYIVPPQKTGTTSVAQRYDSVVDNVTAPTIFVIFSDTQAYPEYLITFQ